MVFSSEENAKTYSSLTSLHNQLDYYIDLESKAVGTATDVESIEKDILSDVNDYIRALNSDSYSNITDYADNVNEKITMRQMIIGNDVDFSQVESELQQQISAINSESCSPTGYITTDESGIFSSYTDGFETLVDYSTVEDLDAETLQNYINQVQDSQNSESNFGKLVTSYEWYFCCVVPASEVKSISNGDNLNVALKSSDETMTCQVVSGADTDLGATETVLILRCSEMNSQITSMRLEDIEIRYNEHTGFKVPASAVHVDADGNKCVYALISNQVSERQGNIIYSTKDYVIFENDSENSDSIRLYDQIITKGTDLHDGKVYS
jgi:putative membrane fusion protein